MTDSGRKHMFDTIVTQIRSDGSPNSRELPHRRHIVPRRDRCSWQGSQWFKPLVWRPKPVQIEAIQVVSSWFKSQTV